MGIMEDYGLEADDTLIPTGLPGGFFIYDAEGDGEILIADQNVIELFGCMTIRELRDYTNNSFKGMVYSGDWDKINNDINAGKCFKSSDIAAFTTDNATFHFIARQ